MSVRALVRRQWPDGEPVVWPAAEETSDGTTQTPVLRLPGAAPPGPQDKNNFGERALAEARQAAFREGEAAGRGQAQGEVRAALERLARSAQEMAALRPRLRQQAEEDLIRLAVAIARRVVRRELTVDPTTVTGLVRAALEQLSAGESARLRVHPEHESIVRAFLSESGRASILVAGDAALERGSAVFETSRGNLDASAEAQLAEIERGLTDRFRSAR